MFAPHSGLGRRDRLNVKGNRWANLMDVANHHLTS
jgi:hypothetical protein